MCVVSWPYKEISTTKSDARRYLPKAALALRRARKCSQLCWDCSPSEENCWRVRRILGKNQCLNGCSDATAQRKRDSDLPEVNLQPFLFCRMPQSALLRSYTSSSGQAWDVMRVLSSDPLRRALEWNGRRAGDRESSLLRLCHSGLRVFDTPCGSTSDPLYLRALLRTRPK